MYLSEATVAAHLSYAALIPAIRQALIDYTSGRVQQPARTILRAGNAEGRANGWFATMPAIAGNYIGVKIVTYYAANDELRLPTHMAVVELIDRANGQPLAIMDGRLITEMRTAAVTAVAFSAIAPLHFAASPTSLGILGSGVQAHAHLQTFKEVWPELAEVRIASRNPANAEKLAAHTPNARAVSIEEASAAEVVLVATTSHEPVLLGRYLQSNAVVLAVGATGATVRELDDEAMQTSFVIAESRECVERESGDVQLSGATVQCEIGELLLHPTAISIPRNQRIVFKSVGMAVEDLTAAAQIWQSLQAASA
ncbi:MAG TPA: ornithine cyclodeaminase family protein [Terracidiphilus sp.]|nr:ornithine cyclodeaminase family protein [Terracidiphilus sp.]